MEIKVTQLPSKAAIIQLYNFKGASNTMTNQNIEQSIQDFWNEFDDAAAELGGGGGLVGEVLIEGGYKVYLGGVDQDKTWYPAPIGPQAKEERKAIIEQVKAFIDNAAPGQGLRPQFGCQIKMFKDGALSMGKPVTWQADARTFNTDQWTEAYKEVVKPSLMEHGIKTPFRGWVRLGFKDDPFGSTETNQQGEERIKQVAYVTQVFKSKEDAYAAAASASDAASGGNGAAAQEEGVPPGYNKKGWEACIPAIKVALNEGQAPATIAESYGVPPMYVSNLIEA